MSTNVLSEEGRRIFRVSEITRDIKNLLEDEFGWVWIEGEISNFSQSSAGHIYFTLKDENAQIRAALFRGSQRGITVKLADGLLVRAYGNVSVYERSGQYQLIVRNIEEAGKGSLQEAFEKLKEKLLKEGLFASERKKPLPLLPQRIGVVTSPTGAAIRDILNVITRRFPNVHVIIAPARVQGDQAAAEIVQGIEWLNRMGNIDVIIAGRGGGSLEDLWCFNEERVARAICASIIPVISAVGHETDFTISDFVADLRAPTPSAAAELVVGRKEAFEETLKQARLRLTRALKTRMLELRNRIIEASSSYVFREPEILVRQYRRSLENTGHRLRGNLKSAFQQSQQRVDEAGLRMRHCTARTMESCRHILSRLESQLRALSPLSVLERGYSVTRNNEGRVIRSISQLKAGSKLTTQVSDGTIDSVVSETNKTQET